jgi:cyclopropane fatty-acyl-phospholipid synthase-like methyltransferase
MTPSLPHAPATARNREPILEVLARHLVDRRSLLEIGSGTGEHAVFFASALPWLQWQCSERAGMLPAVQAWLDHAGLANTPAAIDLDVGATRWPLAGFDAAFSANTLHIMGWEEVEAMFDGLGEALQPEATLVVYGPFNYGGRFTSESNAVFDASLKAADPRRGIRDFEAVDALARGAGLALVEDVAMPANNRTLVWRRG